MSEITKIRLIKRILKISIAGIVIILLIFLGFFVQYNYTFENSNMKKWLVLSEQQREKTLYKIVPDTADKDLLIQCVTKIANLPDSEKMDIRDGVVLCYNGIKINATEEKAKNEQ